MENIYTCEDVAHRYGVRIETIWSWIREKRLAAVKIGKGYRIKESEITAFEQKNQTTRQEG